MQECPQDPSNRVLTVIPCLNEAENLASLLRVLLADPTNKRIVVADGGSTDGSREIVTQMSAMHGRIALLDNPDRIQSAGVNRAVEHYGETSEWIARIDAHCNYPDNYVANLLSTALKRSADAVVVRLKTQCARGFGRGVATAQNSRLGTGGSPHRTGSEGRYVDHGHHALMRISAFVGAGGYCESMPCNEDAELDLRLLKSGNRIWLEPMPPVGYFPRRNPLSLFKQYYRYGIGRATTARRHERKLKLRQMLPLAIAPACFAALASPISALFALPALAWSALCQGWGLKLAIEQRDAAAAWSGTAAMIMHLAWSLGYWRQEVAALLSGGRSLPRPNLPFAAP